jgi:hypothetical protein
MDYVVLNGIRDRTGFEREELYLFVLKELLDNALDYVEKNHTEGCEIPELKVFIIRKSRDKDYLTLKVQNSDRNQASTSTTSVFTIETLRSIFNFDAFFSSKRNQYRISRGALGDALKEVICIPYAIAKEYYNIEWDRPVVITTGNQKFSVSLSIDRINQKIDTKIIQQRSDSETSNKKYTEFEVDLPLIDKNSSKVVGDNLGSLVFNYAIFNTHISFHLEIIDEGEKYKPFLFDFPQLQEINTDWKNTTSIYYYSLQEFENFLYGLNDNDMIAYDALHIFRECSNLKKDHTLTLGALKHDRDKIYEIYTKLREVMKPKAKLDLQFDINSKARSEALKRRVEDAIGIVSMIKYRAEHGYFKTNGYSEGDSNSNSNSNVEFPFVFEFAIIQTERKQVDDGINLNYYLKYRNAINSSPHDYSFLVGNRSSTFRWHSRSSRNNDGNDRKEMTASNIFGMLERYGYSFYKENCKKPNTTVFVNLISPRVDYRNYGKSNINLEPFADTVAETVYKTISSVGGGRTVNALFEEKYTIKDFLKQLLHERHQDIERDPTLKDKDRWTQSTVFYRLRPMLLEAGYGAEEIGKKRQYITKMIRPVSEESLGVKREEIGIFAADRAQLYFKGRWHEVGFDYLERLMHMGTDLLIIEKEGVAQVLTPFADKKGIALLNTRGFLTEYASRLSELSANHSCNVAILSDFDVSGMYLAEKAPNGVYRIGIDFDTVEYFGLGVEDVAESYEANNNHLKPLLEIARSNTSLYDKLQFLKHKRIEIDSIIAKVGSERFWKFVEHRLGERFPTRNYNRALEIPEFVYPDILRDIVEKLEKRLKASIAAERQKIINELSNVSGFCHNLKQKEEEIGSRLKHKIADDEIIKRLIEKMKKLLTNME